MKKKLVKHHPKKDKKKTSPLKLLLLLFAVPIALIVLLIVLGFILACLPFAAIIFIVYQICSTLSEMYKDHLNYKGKLKTNKNYIMHDLKKNYENT